MIADAVEHKPLDFRSRHARDAACFGLSLLQDCVRYIVPVADTELVGVRWAHAVAAVVEDATGQNGGRALEPHLPGDGVGGELGLHGFKQVTVKDRLMLPAMHLAPIGDLADVEPVLEQMGEWAHAEKDTAPHAVISTAIGLGPDAAL